ncbi:MAG: Lrp/AsnC family transcriptional regulator [Syntrophomonadaceae bacterium]|nr:Lrp/AsnC family transcriptional regulator [Syntrophomonadaceae bacterium]
MKNDDVLDLLIKELQGDLPVVSRPYLALAEKVGLTEDEVIDIINRWQTEGLMRRLGAVVRHNRLGFASNALVAWKVDASECDRVGNSLAASSRVSHCYWRQTPADWPYNIFSMIHARTRPELASIIEELAAQVGINEYKTITSMRELKKTSVHYR